MHPEGLEINDGDWSKENVLSFKKLVDQKSLTGIVKAHLPKSLCLELHDVPRLKEEISATPSKAKDDNTA